MINAQYPGSKRRHWFIFPLLLTMLLLVSACGNNTSRGGNANTKNAAAAPAASEQPEQTVEPAAFTTVTTINGEIKIPVDPKRIVAEEYLGSLIALDTIPVGAPGLTLKNIYFKEALAGVADTGAYGKMSPEKILELEPDLIISGMADSYETLSQIAPTIIVPYGDLKNAHEELTYFGELLGKEQEAKAWLAQYDQRIAEAKAKVNAAIPADATFSILEHNDKKVWAYGDNFGRGGQPVYQALGRKPPAEVEAEIMEKQWAEISAEVLHKYAGDYLIVTDNNQTVQDYKNDPIWGSLPAVKNNHIYVWKEERSWYYDPIAVLSQTEELAAWLTE
ncbi:ABC transporter substrate-binding protein [Paenibacillus jilunlii]|uniref:ABC transporter substrate-binding protein n=1 Tax=Paenibacillus jilunlii TaxID=682956 RepID=A0A1G9NL03_9BACL|nr:ABC transporter substrate-binding protein [Paenibacillus jilunlii]KWX77111.1 ABC transporter substrate-binding protein [Paenibacillus jilunlii]SDL86993.1 iron complex transport system substrate-binding protein [Paenibacillus jilunlii]